MSLRIVTRALFLCLTPLALAGQAADGWRVVAPAGSTRCAFDTPFEFWVREGDARRVFIYLQGGGACWDLESCDPRRAAAYDSSIDSTDFGQRRDGIFDRGDAANPFRQYTAIFVPYCTGDLHLGTRLTRYAASNDSTQQLSVHHVGYYNVRSVIDYVARRRTTPRLVTVIGASAGGVAVPMVASEIARRLPGTEVRAIADGAGAFRVPRLRALLAQWAVDSLMTALGAPLASSGDLVVGMYKAAAARTPGVRFAQIGTTSDAVVGAWLSRFGDDPTHVERYISETYRELQSAGLCFTGYTLPGSDHTVLWRKRALSAVVAGEPLGSAIERDVLRRTCDRARPATTGDAAFLFAYRAKPEMEAAFAQGYRRHLDWHAAHADSLSWLAWYVIDGPNAGMFVDGTFGIQFSAFDHRVDPKGDAEDAGRNVTAFADPTLRQVLERRRDLSPSARLETGQPAAMQKVVTLALRPGTETAVERALRTIAAAKTQRLDYAVYERVAGGELPTLVVVVQLSAWADLGRADADPSDAIIRALGPSLVRAEAETWSYRQDLSYITNR